MVEATYDRSTQDVGNILLMEHFSVLVPNQYRFQDIVDPDTGERLFEIEHEVRSATHPMFQRPLVNRNTAQSLQDYLYRRDALVL